MSDTTDLGASKWFNEQDTETQEEIVNRIESAVKNTTMRLELSAEDALVITRCLQFVAVSMTITWGGKRTKELNGRLMRTLRSLVIAGHDRIVPLRHAILKTLAPAMKEYTEEAGIPSELTEEIFGEFLK